MFNLRTDYLGTAQDYERVLKTRNTVLRQVAGDALDRSRGEDMLAVYDQQIAEIGARILGLPLQPRCDLSDRRRIDLIAAP